MLDETSPAMVMLLFAAATAGRAFAPLNYRLADTRIQAAVHELEPLVCLVGPDHAERLERSPNVHTIGRSEVLSARDLQSQHRDPAMRPGRDGGDDEAVLLFTSGTTGSPKVVILRHRHLVSYVLSTVEFMSAREDEAILVSVPPYHIAGVVSVLTSVYAGRRLVQLPQFSPQAWIDTVMTQAVSHAMVVPTMLDRILNTMETRDPRELGSLRHVSYGGGPMPRVTIERALRLLPHVNWVNAYGLTETASTITILNPEDHRVAIESSDAQIRNRLSSVGRPVPGIELEVRGANGTVQEPGEIGELFVRGLQVSGEYRDSGGPASGSWFATRDRGWVDSEGYVYLDGRADDVIVRGGENISPGEIEDVLRSHPAVSDAAAIGLPDEEWGERVEAVVVPKTDRPLDAQELRDLVRDRLRSTRTPDRIHIWPDLPRNELGKLQRQVIRGKLIAPRVDTG